MLGKTSVSLTQNKIRIDCPKQGFVLLSRAPEWKVYLFRPDSSIYSECSFRAFAQNGLAYWKYDSRNIPKFGDTVDKRLTRRDVKTKECGSCILYSCPVDLAEEDNLSPLMTKLDKSVRVTKLEWILVDPKTLAGAPTPSKEALAIARAFLNCPLIRDTENLYPLTYSQVNERNNYSFLFATQAISQRCLEDAAFKLPKNCSKEVKDQSQAVFGVGSKSGAENWAESFYK